MQGGRTEVGGREVGGQKWAAGKWRGEEGVGVTDEGVASQMRAQEFMLWIVPTVKYVVRCHFLAPQAS